MNLTATFTFDWFLDDLKEALSYRDIRSVMKLVDGLLKDQNIKLDKTSETYRKLCREMLKAQIKVLDIDRRRELGDYDDINDKIVTGGQTTDKELASARPEIVKNEISGHQKINISVTATQG